MTTPPTLRDRAIDAAKQAINAGGYWLPPAGQEAAVDAVLALIVPELVASQRRAVRIQQLLDDTRDRVRKIHQPARDWSWTGLGCDHDGAHSNPCAHCRTCYPCPTAASLEPPKETPDA